MEPIAIIGNIGNDVQLRYTPNGKAVLDLNIATYAGKDPNGEKQTVWVKASIWAELAERANANESLHKGSQVQITGLLKEPRIYIADIDNAQLTPDTKVKLSDIRVSQEMTGFNVRLVEKAEQITIPV